MIALAATAAKFLLDPKVLGAIAIAAAVAAVWFHGRSTGRASRDADVARVQKVLDEARIAWEFERVKAAEAALDWEQAARAADNKARETERIWLAAARAIDQDGAKHAETLRAAAGRADAAVVGLRAQLGAVVAEAARAAEAGASAANARQRAATSQATGVLADLLGRCHERSIARARFADAAAAAGQRCERWADEIAP